MLGGNVVRGLVHFFFSLPLIFNFHLALRMAASIYHFVTAATKFPCCPSEQENVSFVFLSLALDLCRPFSR